MTATRAGFWLLLLASACFVLPKQVRCAEYQIVFYDAIESLHPDTIPSPSTALASLPGYPDKPDQLTLAAVVYPPDPSLHGPGPYPCVIILHGSGGLWSWDVIGNGPALQFKDWATALTDEGYLCILPDSFNPRGIPANFKSRRPHHDPAIDDALCSPNYERPKDILSTLSYLKTRADVDPGAIGILAFSHGAQTALNAVMDPSIDKAPYTVDYIDQNGNRVDQEVPAPVQIPAELPFPKILSAYYPGGGHYGYHGSPNSLASNRYMPDQRMDVLMFHGTRDFLLGVEDADATPMQGSLYPIKFALAAQAQADALAVENPFKHHIIFNQADHSFDNAYLEDEANWNTPAEDADEKAKRLARAETLKWFAYHLKPPQPKIETAAAQVSVKAAIHRGLHYEYRVSSDLKNWAEIEAVENEVGGAMEVLLPAGQQQAFFRMNYQPAPPPSDSAENAGFFRTYSEFVLP